MTAASVPNAAPALLPADTSIDWNRITRFGGLLALGLVFISLAGMPLGLNQRTVIEPVLSLGYLALMWLPFLAGYNVGNEIVLEGMEATKKGPRDLLGGLIVGAIGGVGLSILVLLIDNFDLRDPLVNWSPQLLEFLNFENGVGFGSWIWIPFCGLLGLAGASLQLMSQTMRRAVMTVILAVIVLSVFEFLIIDIVDPLKKVLYAQQGGLKWGAAIVVAILAAAFSLFGREPISQVRSNYNDATGPEKSRQTAVLIGLSVLALIVIPMFTGKITQELLANVGIFLLLALGLNIVVGLAGILDLGYVAFFAVGGYTTAVLTSSNRGEDWPSWFPSEIHWVLALIATVIMAGIVGLIIGAPVIRMRGDYLAIVTLGFGEIIRLLFLSDWLNGYFNGAQGITNIPPADFGIFEIKGTDPRSVFYLVLFFAAISIYVSWRLERSRLGRAWMAIREDESVAEAMGINTVNVKLMAFVVGAVLASFSGAIFATKVGSIFPTSFLILVSIIILVVVIVGGMGNIVGVIVGAFVLIGVLGGPKQPGLLQEFSEYKLLIYGALLIWMMLKRPEGLVPNARRSRELHQDEFLQDAWLKGEVDDAVPDSGDVDGTVAPA